jgi:hypothetical protein
MHTPLRRRLLAFSLMGLALGASAAPVLSSMTCVMSGHRVLAIGSIDDCCPDKQTPGRPVIEATCCAFAQAVPVKEDYRPEPPIALAGLDHVSPVFQASMDIDADLFAERIITRPPPLSAPLRLSRISLYLL